MLLFWKCWGQKRHYRNLHWYCHDLQVACICCLDKVHGIKMNLISRCGQTFSSMWKATLKTLLLPWTAYSILHL